MNRAKLWSPIWVIAFWLPWFVESVPAQSQRPNFVIVMVDDLRWDELGCAGHPFVRTPHIDRLAREGIRFRNAFCTTVLCSPARASFFTGQYLHRHGIVDNTDRSVASHRLITFPLRLQQAGYNTGFIGKWHMGNDASPRPGFSEWNCLAGQGTSHDPLLNEHGSQVAHPGYTTDVLNKKAVEFVQRNRAVPFCLIVAHKALHPETVQFADGSLSDPSAAKFIPADRHRNLYRDTAIPRRLNVVDSLVGKPALRQPIAGLAPLSRDTGTNDETVRDRLRMLAAVEEGMGQLLNALQQIGQLDNTVLIFTSDHGYWYGEHGLSVERRLAYEEGIRIPLLVRYPKKFSAGMLVDEMVLGIDIAPTVMELAEVSTKLDADGASLLPLMQSVQPVAWRKSFLIEYSSDTVFPRMHKLGYRAIRTEAWKYIRYLEQNGMDELYNLRTDPYEMNNLIEAMDDRDTLKQLQDELQRLESMPHRASE